MTTQTTPQAVQAAPYTAYALTGQGWVIEHWALGRTRTTVAKVPDGPTAAHITALLNLHPYSRH